MSIGIQCFFLVWAGAFSQLSFSVRLSVANYMALSDASPRFLQLSPILWVVAVFPKKRLLDLFCTIVSKLEPSKDSASGGGSLQNGTWFSQWPSVPHQDFDEDWQWLVQPYFMKNFIYGITLLLHVPHIQKYIGDYLFLAGWDERDGWSSQNFMSLGPAICFWFNDQLPTSGWGLAKGNPNMKKPTIYSWFHIAEAWDEQLMRTKRWRYLGWSSNQGEV